MSSVTVLSNKLPVKTKTLFFGVATGFLPHVMVPKGGSEVETPVGNLVNISFATMLIE